VRRVDARIGRVYAWSARAPITEGSRLAVDYLLSRVRAFCATLN
jgi:hypothetical protein